MFGPVARKVLVRMKSFLRWIAAAAAGAVLAGCTKAYYDQKRAAGDTPAAEARPALTKNDVTAATTNVATSINKGAAEFGDYLKKHGLIIHTKENPPAGGGK